MRSETPEAVRQRFVGAIAGTGSTSGVRVVVGRWDDSPWGPFADVMVETAAGHRVLLAPDARVTDFVASTYHFDELREEPVSVRSEPGAWTVLTPSLRLWLVTGGRTPLGRLLSVVPSPVAASPAWCAVTDPVARVALRGVRTRGGVRAGRRSFYGALDVVAVTGLRGSFDGLDLGTLADVDPPCRFGFSSVPRRPSVTRVVTTVDVHG
ncbi:MAG: hypothetical protein U0R80_20170 [Nocardioidaceae bacterium]